jgi:hypothetical protein
LTISLHQSRSRLAWIYTQEDRADGIQPSEDVQGNPVRFPRRTKNREMTVQDHGLTRDGSGLKPGDEKLLVPFDVLNPLTLGLDRPLFANHVPCGEMYPATLRYKVRPEDTLASPMNASEEH